MNSHSVQVRYEFFLQSRGYWSRLSLTDYSVIDHPHSNHLCCSAGDEYFVRDVQLVASE
jgi:hypothetical protein